MNKEELIKLCKDEFKNNVMENLDSALVFIYIKNLEENIKKLKQEKEELVEWLEENKQLKERIQNATDYVNSNLDYIDDNYISLLLDILQGNEER